MKEICDRLEIFRLTHSSIPKLKDSKRAAAMIDKFAFAAWTRARNRLGIKADLAVKRFTFQVLLAYRVDEGWAGSAGMRYKTASLAY